jgi:hypothetical protein
MDVFAVTEGIIPTQETQDGHDDPNANPGSHGEEANKFQRAISAWRGAKIQASCECSWRLLTILILYRY